MIDISAARLEELYNSFDRTAPLTSKELHQGFVRYLVDSVREIGRAPFVIRVRFQASYPEPVLDEVKRSIRNFFRYMEALQRRARRRTVVVSLLLVALGLTLLAGSGAIRQFDVHSVALGVLSEGVVVAAWVALWEAVATFLIRFPDERIEARVYRRVAGASIDVVCDAMTEVVSGPTGLVDMKGLDR